ncbi:MAG: tetratricopeptide repeat protein [Planctomycetota bacterium]
MLKADAEAGSFLTTGTHDVDPDATFSQSNRRPAPAAPAEKRGQMIGRYKLLEQIGEGGFGTVWVAEQKEPVKRRVALKIIKLGMDTKQVIARFEAERQALAMMDHPNIAKVFDAGATETGRPYFVMEYVRGVGIVEYCDTEKSDTRARLDLFTKVCHAIQHAHQKGIIHRDIKPSNVLITLHDGVPLPKVIDFGIAKATNAELTQKTVYTEHRQMIGTPAYMSPEQAEMSGLDIDTRSDVYSLGVLLYEMLTGTTPFDSQSLMEAGLAEMMRIIREVEPHKPSTRLSTLGETASRAAEQRRTEIGKLGTLLRGDLDWIVMKCLEKDRTRRYETASGLAADIVRHLGDEPVVAGPPSTGYRVRKFVKRNRVAVIAGSMVAIALLLGIAGTTGGLLWALNQKERATSAELATQRELTRAKEVKRLITEMLANVSPAMAQGADITVLKRILDDTARRLTRGEIADELISAELHNVIGVVYRDLGLGELAERHIPIALETRTRLLGQEHPLTLQSRYEQLALDADQRRVANMETTALDLLEMCKRVLGPEHPDTLRSMEALTRLYGGLGRLEEAEPLLERTLEARKRVLGNEHRDTLTSLSQMGYLYDQLGRTAEAEELIREALELRARALGDDHPDTLISMQNLMRFLQIQGRYEEAEPVLKDLTNRARRVLGNHHQDVLELTSDLNQLYIKLERYDDACAAYEAELQIRRDTQGDQHPRTLQTMRALAGAYLKLERYNDACAAYEAELQIRRDTQGVEHPRTWQTMRALAGAYLKVERDDEALTLCRELLEQLPARADDTTASSTALFTVAWVLTRDIEELRNPEKAADFSQHAVNIAKKRKKRLVHQYLDMLALAQYQAGKTAEAIETQKRAIARIPERAKSRFHDRYQTALHAYEETMRTQEGAAAVSDED